MNNALVIVSVTETTGMFLSAIPGILDIARQAPSAAATADTRRREIFAAGLSVGTGVAVGMLGGSMGPVWASVITSAILVTGIELALHHTSKSYIPANPEG